MIISDLYHRNINLWPLAPPKKSTAPSHRFDLLVTAIKANQQCKQERQNFSVLRSTPLGKHIEPEIAKEAAISLIDCFHRLYVLLNAVSSTPSKLSADNPQSNVCRKVATAVSR